MLFTVVGCGRGDGTDARVGVGEVRAAGFEMGSSEQARMKKLAVKIILRMGADLFILFSPLIKLFDDGIILHQ
jgi:hypothetical protein